jgi:uncharacterized protein (TIGR02001 family)
MNFALSFPPLRRLPALLLLYWIATGPALAQFGATASVVSDYRVRGVSLSDGRAVPQLNLSYDNPQGWYAGAFASNVTLRNVGDTQQAMGYVGYAQLIAPGLSWEAGGSKSVFRSATLYDYNEVFVGLAADRISGRLSYAPNYFGKSSHSLYAEINGNYPLTDTLRLTGHLGVLHSQTPDWLVAITPAYRADIRVGVSLDIDAWKLQAALIATQKKHPAYLYEDGGSQRALNVSIAYDF